MDYPPPKGRGAQLLALLKKREQEKAVGIQAECREDQTAAVPDDPPKPRGRAALLLKIQESKLKRVGLESAAIVSITAAAPSVSSTAAAPSISQLDSTISQSHPEQLANTFSEITLADTATVTYRGESGKSLNISANYIKLHLDKDRGVYEYEVKFQPDLDAKGRRIKALNNVVKELGGVKVFDGGNVLYLPERVVDSTTTIQTSVPTPDGDLEVSVTVIFKKKKKLADRECLHLYNVLLKRIMYELLYVPMGRNYFDMRHKHLIPQHKLEVYPGFAVSVDEQEDGLMLCLDTQHRVLRTQNAYELLTELRVSSGNRFKEMANANIIGSCIFTRYNNKTYVVDDIAWDMSPQDTFPTRDGRTISFIDYFKAQHNISIKDVYQPLLINRKNVNVPGKTEKEERMVCLIPEISYLTGLTDSMRADFKVMKDVAQYTRVTPAQRMNALRTYLENVQKSEKSQKILNDWGLKIADQSLNLRGRQLKNECVYFGGDKYIETNNNADWNRAVSEHQVTGPVDIYNWLVFYTSRDERYAKDFAQTMVRIGSVMGCRITPPKPVLVRDDRNESYMNACRENIHKDVQVAVFICPTMRSDRYALIKKICCTQIPVASQVINSRTLSNPQKVRSIIQKIALQINCKLGGTLWHVRFPFKGWAICGIDVYHGSGSSVCGFVGSLNESISRWHSSAMFQDKELGDFYKIAFTKYLEACKNQMGYFPSKVVIIRDGVGDGQLDYCQRYEVEQLESVIKQFNLETKLCFIVVQKRINTRIFSRSVEGGYENPPPGTILDHSVTRRALMDFFMVPQNVRQGTVNPTHYIVLHDTCKLKPDQAQILCYKLCHLYYNWPGTIRVPAPCQYAHKLAALVGQHIKKMPSSTLSDTLFYL